MGYASNATGTVHDVKTIVDWAHAVGALVFVDAVRFPELSGRRLDLRTGMTALREYDHVLSAAILDELETLPGVHIHGIAARDRLTERVPTVSFTWGARHPKEIAAALGVRGIYVWDGHYYALAVVEQLGLADSGGMVRVGAVHYNTVNEIRQLGDALHTMV